MDKNKDRTGGLVIGTILLVLGIFSLIGNVFDFLDSDTWWPLIVVGVGAVFLVAAVLGRETRASLAVPGSIVVTVGLILFVLNYTDAWEAWSYCWALIVAASGVGVWVNGVLSGQAELRKRGLDTLFTGLTLFLVFAVIMEFIFSMTGEHRWMNASLWAVLLAVLGLLLLVVRLLRIGKPGAERIDLFWPILMIGVGLTAVLIQENWMPAENLWGIFVLWPVLLIVAGVGMLLRNRSPWVGASLGIAVVAVLLAAGFTGQQWGLPGKPDWFSDFGSLEINLGERERVVASGDQVSEQRPVSGVSRVELAIPAELVIRQGAVEELTVRANRNVLAVLTTNVSGGKLTIRYKPLVDVRTSQPPQVTLTVKDLSSLELSSTGSVVMDSLKTGKFSLALSSTGDIDIKDLQAERIDADLSSSGGISLSGSAGQLVLDVSSSGNFEAGDLQVQDAVVTLSSSGDITLWVVDDLRSTISSSGDIRYYGSPTVNQNISSSGKMVPLGEK